MRHIAASFLVGGRFDGVERVIRWLTLNPTYDGIEVWDQEVSDLGEDFPDFYELADIEAEPVAIFSEPTLALEFAQSRLGALPTRWVNEGLSESEFKDFISAGRPAQWPSIGA